MQKAYYRLILALGQLFSNSGISAPWSILEHSAAPTLEFLSQWMRARTCVFNKFSGDVHAACLEVTLWEPLFYIIVVVQSLSHVQLFAIPWTTAHQASLSIPCPSPRICSDSHPLSQWCHPTISSSVVPFSSCLQSFPASGSFSMSQLFAAGSESIGASASASVLPMNSGLISFRIGWFDLLAVQGTSKSLLQPHSLKASVRQCSAFFIVQLSHLYMTTGKTIALTIQTLVGKVMSLLFNMLSRLVVAFLLRSKWLLISWLQSPSAVILEPQKIKSVTVSIVFLSMCHKVMGPDAMIFIFWMLSFKSAFSLSPFTFIKRLFNSFLSAERVVSSAYLRLLIFLLTILIPACDSRSLCLVTQSCQTLFDPMNSSPPVSSVHRIL